MAHALSVQGKFDEAEAMLLEVIAGQEETTGDNNSVNLPTYGIGVQLYRQKGELNESLEYGERIQAIIDSDPKPLTWAGALALIEYGHTLAVLGRDDEAEKIFDRANAVLRSTFGDADPRVIRLNN